MVPRPDPGFFEGLMVGLLLVVMAFVLLLAYWWH
jgi:hypothetical protein